MLWIIIPARRGSQGVPDKNIRPLPDGSTCLSRALDVAKSVAESTEARIVVSTDYRRDELGPVSMRATILNRPKLLAGPDAPMLAVMGHVLAEVDAVPSDAVCVLQPSSPFRSAATVLRAVKSQSMAHHPMRGELDAVCTAMRYPSKWHPDYELRVDKPMPSSRHDLREAFRPDGGAYVADVVNIVRRKSWGRMDWVVSPACESLSIDTPEDWSEAERRIREG